MHFANRKGLPRALVISFCSGLCLCNQHTAVFYIIPIALWTMLSGGWALWRPRSLALLSVAALSGECRGPGRPRRPFGPKRPGTPAGPNPRC